MSGETVLPSRTVVIDDGIIATIDPDTRVGCADARSVDGSGRFLMPGLADMHVHYSDPGEAALYLANGVTTVRTMWGSPTTLALREMVRRRELAGPRVITASPIVDGPGPDGRPAWPGSRTVSDQDQASAAVAEYAARGYDQIKVYDGVTPEVLAAIAAAARRHGLRVVGHRPSRMTYTQAVDAGMTCFEHLDGAELLDPLVLQRLAARDVHVCPTVVVSEQMARDPDAPHDASVAFVAPVRVRAWTPARDRRFAPPGSQRDRVSSLRRTVGALHAHGVPLLAGTDAGNPFVVPGFALHQELVHLVAAGLSPYAALCSATSAPARFMGAVHRWGTVVVGAQADLLLVSGNPLEDVRHCAIPDAVFVNGFDYTRAGLARMLSERAVQVRSLLPDDPGPPRPPPGEGTTVAAGHAVEHLDHEPVGRLRYRHDALTGGRRRIVETYVNGLRGTRRHTTLDLTPEAAVLNADIEETTLVGRSRWQLTHADGGYRLTVTDVDGWRTTDQLRTDPLPAGENLSLTAMGALIAARGPGEFRAVEVAATRLDVTTVSVTPLTLTPAAAPAPRGWQARFVGREHTSVCRYLLDDDGSVLGLWEPTRMGERTFLASTGSGATTR